MVVSIYFETFVKQRLGELDGTTPLEEVLELEKKKKHKKRDISEIIQSPFLGKYFREWMEERKTYGMALKTRCLYLQTFLKFLRVSEYLGRNIETLEVVTPQYLMEFIKVCRDEQSSHFLKSTTLKAMLPTLRMFFTYLGGKLNWEYTNKFNEIKAPKITDGKVVEPEDLISKDELHTLLRNSFTTRDKCLIALIFEAGMRISEALDIRIKDIQIEKTHMNIKLRGTKTKNARRRITVIDCQKYILDWLSEHPLRDNTEAPLFVGLRINYGKKLTYEGSKSILNRIIKRSGLRHISWHLFRHTAATTEAVRGMNPKLMNKKFGWEDDSRTPFVYIALKEKDLEDYELERKGIKVAEKEERERVLQPKVCPRCAKHNDPTAIYCNCGSALDPKVLAEQIGTRDETLDNLKQELEQMKKQNVELMDQMKELFKMMNEKRKKQK